MFDFLNCLQLPLFRRIRFIFLFLIPSQFVWSFSPFCIFHGFLFPGIFAKFYSLFLTRTLISAVHHTVNFILREYYIFVNTFTYGLLYLKPYSGV